MTDKGPPYPRTHKRSITVAEADLELREILSAWRNKYLLTPSEYTMLLAGMLEQHAALLVVHERRE
jgi:hypothetical protein